MLCEKIDPFFDGAHQCQAQKKSQGVCLVKSVLIRFEQSFPVDFPFNQPIPGALGAGSPGSAGVVALAEPVAVESCETRSALGWANLPKIL